MNTMKKHIALLAAVPLLLAGGTGVAHAANTVQIRENDLTTSVDAGGGSHAFTKDGIFINVPDPDTDYVVLRWNAGVPFSDVTSVDYGWDGTNNRPGVKYDVDADGDGTADCELIGEDAYGGQEVWLNADAGENAGTADSDQEDGYCASVAPESNEDGPTATGYDYDGTLAQWNDAFGEDAEVIETGIGASGISQQGTLTYVNLGDTTYSFADAPTTGGGGSPAPVENIGQLVTKKLAHSVYYTFTTSSGTVHWTVTQNGSTKRLSFDQTAASGSKTVRYVNHKKHGKKVFRVYKNGVKVSTVVVLPRS